MPPVGSLSEPHEDSWRPQVHFSPPEGFMNDPNGLFVDAQGTYHLYYQYNPTGILAGNQHWGHATSKDLFHWFDQPIAIYPPDAESQVFSGSVVIDVKNTSSFFPDQSDGVVAIYTLNTPGAQVQEIAYSRDGGYTFTPFEGNPVIDGQSTQFRDPKVVWHAETQRWIMVVAYAQEFIVAIYTSPDLKTWTHASDYSHHGLLGLQYECPNLVRVPVRDAVGAPQTEYDMYVLTLSINPGAPLGGSTTQYFPGNFDGTQFTPVDGATRLADFAKDNYAAQFFYGTPEGEDALSLGWASNWQYTEATPTAREGWRGVMTLPRRSFLTRNSREGWVLVSLPVELSPVLCPGPIRVTREHLGGDMRFEADLRAVKSGAYHFEIVLPTFSRTATEARLTFELSNSASGESVSGGWLFALGGDCHFYLDRGRTHGFDHPLFTDGFSTSVVAPGEGDYTWTLSAVFDRSILEVFVNGGAASATMTVFPEGRLTMLAVRTAGIPEDVLVNVVVHGLKSVWEGGRPRRIPRSRVDAT
ncbi:glycosyl hydrolase [Dichomitus squalens]|uniref:Glycosyl hydrolase n=1 Tax=Dichomitus squalens TaxID=114155 RepID=A0A4Q9MQR8_9APHY|nr:glycosyl hydrolase [Dichomitus squalens]